MKSDPNGNDVPIPTPPIPGGSDPITHLNAECERLRRRVLELETEKEHDRHQFAELEVERDQYRAEAAAWARKEFERKGIDEEELTRRIEQEDGVPLEAFLGELERVARGT